MSVPRCITKVCACDYKTFAPLIYGRGCFFPSGHPYQGPASAAKAGLDALSRVIAVEEGPRGVRSNVIAPGPIGDTEGMDRLSTGVASDVDRHPLGRIGHLTDVSNATIFLFSGAAANITGQILPVDGGHWQLAAFQLPYPQAVLDPESVKHMFKPRL
jgi:2,4-dienoyl-CoA reductase [(3E)-enoyl-CoA-producing], peroxisomal